MVLLRHFAKAITLGGLAFLLLPIPSPVPAFVQRLDAQAFPGRLRRPPPGDSNYPPPAGAQTSAPNPAPAAPQTAAPLPQPAGALPPSMLQQPAQPATVQFSAESLSIHADNSSLREILHQISVQTGMEVQGLDSDERVFGTFGPGKPQDVITDLLNGIPYDVLTVGVLDNGAPRQLVLSPASHVAASAAPSSPPPPANDDDAAADNDTQQGPQGGPAALNPPSAPAGAAGPAGPAGPAVQSPQALFQQLQQMRERQQQQQQDQQQQQQPQQQQPQPQQQPPPPQQ
jgi:hypothetical protein